MRICTKARPFVTRRDFNAKNPLAKAGKKDANVGEKCQCPDDGTRIGQIADVQRDVDDAQRDKQHGQDVDPSLACLELVGSDIGNFALISAN